MEQNTPYPPLMRGPLKMRGVFGLSWQLYKRGFWPMFLFTLAIIGVVSLIAVPAQMSMFKTIGASGMPLYGDYASGADSLRSAASMTQAMGISWLLSLAYMLLVMPAYLGATFLEMDQRMEGRVGTFGQLLRYALPIGFKRFYTTFLSMVLVYIIFGTVLSFVMTGIMIAVAVSSFASGMSMGSNFAMAGVLALIIILIVTVYLVFMVLIYPVAVHEGKRAFKAVGRGMKLSLKRFGRLLAAMLLYMLLVTASEVLFALPLLFSWQNPTTAMIIAFIGLTIWSLFMAPYFSAFCTALYVDAAARVPDVPPEAPVLPQVS